MKPKLRQMHLPVIMRVVEEAQQSISNVRLIGIAKYSKAQIKSNFTKLFYRLSLHLGRP